MKEHSGEIPETLPFSILPKQLVICVVYYVVKFLNCHIFKLGVSNIFLPRKLFLRKELDWIKHYSNKVKALDFGEYRGT